MVVAGGTGGHIFPAKAMAQVAQNSGWSVLCVGTQGDLEREHLSRDFDFVGLNTSGLRGKSWWSRCQGLWRMGCAWFKALGLIRRFKPDVMLCMGGYVTVPLALAAWCMRVPVILHEQNAVAGLSNVYLSHVARRVLEAFPHSFPKKITAITVGNPVRQAFLTQATPQERLASREHPYRLLVVGGSQGAQALNQLSLDLLGCWGDETSLVIKHQTGAHHYDKVLSMYQSINKPEHMWQLTPFIHDMADAYAWADAVICRSGALTVAEVCAVGLPAILVPYPSAVDDHQTKNAAHLVSAGAAWVYAQPTLDAPTIRRDLEKLITDHHVRVRMAETAYHLSQRDSAQVILSHCEQVAHRLS